MSATEAKDTSPVNRQYVQRCLFNWRHQLQIDLTVEEHAIFRENKKHYLKVEQLDPSLICKMIKRFHPDFQFPANPIPIPIPPPNNNV
jgi:hypothetical protein